MSVSSNKRMALFFNSPYLGGAERSMVHQAAALVDQLDWTCFVPNLAGVEQEVIPFLEEHLPGAKIESFSYPKALYSISRTGKLSKLITLPFSLISSFLTLRSLKLNRFHALWCNGNKVALVVFFTAFFVRYKNTLYWHFRDYPTTHPIFSKLWSLVDSVPKSFELKTIANSKSVASALTIAFPKNPHPPILFYNPVGESLSINKQDNIEHIAVASMFAPWKGLHQVIMMASLYEEELIELGIKSISLYGDNPYQTQGAHNQYPKQLVELLGKFPSKLIQFPGRKKPSEIFSSNQLIIHPSISPEPFGRVIIEGMKARIPVISSFIGGAAELRPKNNPLQFFPHDYQGLFSLIKKMSLNPSEKNSVIIDQLSVVNYIEGQIESTVKEFKKC